MNNINEDYNVSRAGEVSSFKRDKVSGNIIVTNTDKYGYKKLGLYIDGVQKNYFIHRLVAQAFIPNPDNKPCVNHIDGDKLNNHVDNLEWCTNQENMAHAHKTGLMDKVIQLNEKAVVQLSIQGNFIKEFKSIREVERQLHINHAHISAVCLGKRPTAGNYKWEYA